MSSVKKEERLKKSIGARVAVDGVGEGTLRCVVCGVMQLFVLCVCAMQKSRAQLVMQPCTDSTRTAAQTPTRARIGRRARLLLHINGRAQRMCAWSSCVCGCGLSKSDIFSNPSRSLITIVHVMGGWTLLGPPARAARACLGCQLESTPSLVSV